jgi:hypothetical protein
MEGLGMKTHWLVVPRFLLIGVFALWLVGCGGGGRGGETTGTVQGTVTNAADASPIAGATVAIQGTGLQDATDAQGEYSIANVPAGAQTVVASATGFTSQTLNVTVTTGGAVTADFALTASAATGDTYYVSPTGNNANPGTLAQPWATPGYGSRQLQPGDTLIILGGTYVLDTYDDDIIIPQASGTANAWITIRGETGNRPVLQCGENLLTAVDLSGRSYIRLENLEITNHDGQPFRDGIELMETPGAHIVFKDLYVHHLDEFGLNIQDVDDLRVEDCRIEYCGFGAVGGPTAAADGWTNVVITGCSLSYSGHYYQGGAGPSPYDRPDGFGIEPSDGPVEIANTVAEHNRGDGLDSKARNTSIHECIVANNSCDGVKLWGDGSTVTNTLIYGRGDGDMGATPWSPVVIHTEEANATFGLVNVTVDDYVGQNYLMHVQYDAPTTPVNLTIRNCIFSSRGEDVATAIFLAEAVNATIQYNLFWTPQSTFVVGHGANDYTSAQVGALGTGNRYGDPLFVSPAFGADGDYHVQTGSPAINNGTATGAPSTDLEGTARPQGAGHDIGAYER